MSAQEQIDHGMRLARECTHKYANAANWAALYAHLERMTQTIPGTRIAGQNHADWSAMVAEMSKPDDGESVQASAIAENNSRRIPGNY